MSLDLRRLSSAAPGFDAELQQLTIKSLGSDTEVRGEVNLELGLHAGDQEARVESFLGHLGLTWSGTIHKDVEVWYYPECEVVLYEAATESKKTAKAKPEAEEEDFSDIESELEGEPEGEAAAEVARDRVRVHDSRSRFLLGVVQEALSVRQHDHPAIHVAINLRIRHHMVSRLRRGLGPR